MTIDEGTCSFRLIAFFCLSTGILFNLIIPPFQYPDEPQHFGAILTYSLGNEKKDFIEKEIIKIMDQNSWWRLVGLGKPTPLPSNFLQTDFLTFDDFKVTFGNIILYHFLLGKTQKSLVKNNFILSYYFCRAASLLFMLISIFLVYLTFRKDPFAEGLYLGTLFVLFLHQLAILSSGVSSDSLSLVLSCLFFFASFSLILGKLKVGYFLLLFLSAGAGILTDRSILFLLPMALFVPFFLLKRNKHKANILILFFFFLAFGLLILLLWKTLPLQFNNSLNFIKWRLRPNIQKLPSLFSFSDANQQFLRLLMDSFLLKFGWMAFDAGRIFHSIWRGLVLLSSFGILSYFARYRYSRKRKTHPLFYNSNILKLAIFSLIPLSIQILNLWAFSEQKGSYSEGRYLFPVIVPIAFLFLLGLKAFFDLFHKKAGTVAISVVLILEFLFLNYSIWDSIIPIFHMTVKAPHLGI